MSRETYSGLSNRLIRKLPEKYHYSIHNLLGHPLMEVCHILGKPELADKIHDLTLPY